MELFKTFSVIFLTFLGCEAFEINSKSSLVCEALKRIPEQIKLPKSSTVDILTMENSSETFNCFKTIIIENDLAFTVVNDSKASQLFMNRRKKQFVVIAVDSLNSLRSTLRNMTADHYNHDGYYIVILTTNSTSNLDAMFHLLWQSFIYNVNILVQVNNSVKMFTFFPFNQFQCHDTKPREINEYSKGKWQKKLFFPPKLRNFHKCQLKASCFQYGPSAQKTFHENGTSSLSGSDVEILTAISKALNIDLVFKITTVVGSWGQVWENGSAVGAFKQLMKQEIDICANFYFLTELRSKFIQFTQAYFSISMVVMIPRGAQLSAFQKLFRPFELPVWIFVAVFLFIACCAVIVIRCQSRKIQILFFDRNINAPMMEMLVILFGSSQHVMPRKSFSRLLLMSFAIYCFVIRTIYTGSLYKFLQVNFTINLTNL
jgi:Bacterial extracellular solute-binding proteins, family 3